MAHVIESWGRAALLLMIGLSAAAQERPNFVVIFADDLGYGDLGGFGSPTISTPSLDRMAAEGQKWTNFYVGAAICTPSRAALLTGRLPIRSGLSGGVFFPYHEGGLPESEITIAEMLKPLGYSTAIVGKWHLGHLPQFLPTNQGFDSYFGIPYSNDMDGVPGSPRFLEAYFAPKVEYWNVPLMRNEEIVERPADQTTITKRYTEEAVRFIESNRDQPFFLYLAHSMPHTPLFRSKEFADRSIGGRYGDVVEEIDWSVSRVLETLRTTGLAEKTMVVFTSDNGPWLLMQTHGGSAGPLRGGKQSTWEGGMRVPAIFWWPGKIPSRIVRQMGSTLDLLPTIAGLAGAKIADDRALDGFDLSKALLDGADSPRDHMIYYRDRKIFAARLGPYKAHFITRNGYAFRTPEEPHDPPLLHHLLNDMSERFDIAENHPDVIERIEQLVEAHKQTVQPAENQYLKGENPNPRRMPPPPPPK